MLHRRSFTVTAILMLLAMGSGAASWALWQQRLPDPATADTEGLMRWLVTRDLSDEPIAIRQRLLTRLEKELRAGVDLQSVDEQVSEQRRELFWQNVDVLLEDWFRQETVQFAQISDPVKQKSYIETKLDEMLAWRSVQQLRANFESKPGGEFALLQQCQERTTKWINTAPPGDAKEMKDLSAALRQAILLRALNGKLAPDA